MEKINYSVSRTSQNKTEKLYIGPKLDAGGKPSTLFPPGGLVKLTATPAQVNQCKKNNAKQ